jgi:hypothetical protein
MKLLRKTIDRTINIGKQIIQRTECFSGATQVIPSSVRHANLRPEQRRSGWSGQFLQRMRAATDHWIKP